MKPSISNHTAEMPPKPMVIFGKRVPDAIAHVMRKTWQVVKEIFKALGVALLFVTTPNLFAFGLLVGVAFEIRTKKVVDKVMNVWETQSWEIKALLGAGAFLALPVTLTAVTFLSAAYYGSRFTRAAQKHMAKKNKTPLLPHQQRKCRPFGCAVKRHTPQVWRFSEGKKHETKEIGPKGQYEPQRGEASPGRNRRSEATGVQAWVGMGNNIEV